MQKNIMNKEMDTGLASFIIIANFLGIHVDEMKIRHSLAIENEQFREVYMVRAAKELDMKAKVVKTNYKELGQYPLPAIVKSREGEFFVVAKIEKNKIMILIPSESHPQIIEKNEFNSIWSGTVILLKKKKREGDEAFGFRWFVPSVFQYKRQLIQVLIAAFTIQLLGVFSPIITQVVVDKVLVHHSYSTLIVVSVGLGLIYLYDLIMSIAKNYVLASTTNKIDVMLNARLFKHLMNLPLKYFETRRVGDTIARVRELENIRQFLTGAPLNALLDVMFLIVYIVVLFFYNTKLTWITLSSLPIFALLSGIVTPLFKRRLDKKFSTGAEVQSFLVESISGVQTIKSFALEPKMDKKWGELQSDYVTAGYKMTILGSNTNVVGAFIQKIFDLIILYLGAKLVISGELTVGALVAFRMLSSRVSGPVLRFVQLWQEFQQASLSVRRIGDIFASVPETSSSVVQSNLPSIKGKISFNKVRFRYRVDAPEVVNDLSFTIEAGSIIGIVGRSGSGKSTIAKLIQRLYVPEAGKISVDNMDISLVDSAWLRSQIGVVLQENFMFNMSVKDNICIHHPVASMKNIVHVAKISGAHDFILELQHGYDTVLGERGVTLSGGQKQRIAIARALLKNPKILIFDEATSALDYESEKIIQDSLQSICKNRTVIIIAHRLSTVMGADKIMTIDKGSLIEYDTPMALKKQKGLFNHLFSQQNTGGKDE